MPIQISCKCGYVAQAADWNSADVAACPDCGGVLSKTVIQHRQAAPKSQRGGSSATSSNSTRTCAFCGEEIPGAANKCKHCGEVLGGQGIEASEIDADEILAEYHALVGMRRRYNLLSFTFALPGMAVMIAPAFLRATAAAAFTRGEPVSPFLIRLLLIPAGFYLLIGVVMIFVGFASYARYKGRSVVFAFLGFLNVLGLIALAALKDYNAERLMKLKWTLRMMGRKV